MQKLTNYIEETQYSPKRTLRLLSYLTLAILTKLEPGNWSLETGALLPNFSKKFEISKV